MAETLAEKLKRLAAEKKAAAAQASPEVVEVANVQPVEETKHEDDKGSIDPASGDSATGTQGASTGSADLGSQKSSPYITTTISSEPTGLSRSTEPEVSGQVIAADLEPTPSNHPLAMQFAEMEQALLGTDPRFKTILRDVHRHLGQDPDLVTMMTEAEVALIVRGLVTFANAEIVAPAKAKAVKAATKSIKNISADDL